MTTHLAWRRLLVDAIERLHSAGVVSPTVDARGLLEFAVMQELAADESATVGKHTTRFEPLNQPHFTAAQFAGLQARYSALLERRCHSEPLQLIVGTTGFRYLELQVRHGVFIPRPETEVVAQAAIDELKLLARYEPGERHLAVDLCSGSGAIAVSLATECAGAQVFAVELNPLGAELTTVNATRAQCGVAVVQGDATDLTLFPDLAGHFAVVISNPPYIPSGAVPRDREVLDYDPHESLFGGGEDGLDVPRGVMAQAARLLRPGGLFVMEHADSQGQTSRAAIRETGAFESIMTGQDLNDRDRFLVARRAQKPEVSLFMKD